MMCMKEERENDTGLAWKLMVGIIVLAILVGAAVAAATKFG
jgi:hypothetical protein